MKRRICLVGAALSVCPLAFIAGPATAASAKSITCSTKTSISVANGQDNVLPPVSQGQEYGSAHCGGGLGGGVETDSFKVPLSGDTVAKYTIYLNAGTVHGSYDLTPESGSLNFLATTWTGTLKVLGGTGAYKGAAGTGTLACQSLDGIHTTCTDKLKLKSV